MKRNRDSTNLKFQMGGSVDRKKDRKTTYWTYLFTNE